jgi:cellobiose phosphorylase
MAPLCRARGDHARADDFTQRAQRLRERLEAGAWDGRW